MATTDPEVPGPPEHLSERAQGLWREIVPRRAVSPERLALLQVALEALDRADAARQVIAQEGMITTTKTTGAVHVHPLVKLNESPASSSHGAGAKWGYRGQSNSMAVCGTGVR
jgi:phage terminase small subunit